MKANKNKIVYIVTTTGCSACKFMENIMTDVRKDYSELTFTTTSFKNVPEWIKDSIIFTDFPTTIFVDNNTIKYHFTGTKSKNKIIKIINNIGF